MSLVSQITTLVTRIATEFKTVRSETTTALSGKANLSGASFTGDVSTSGKLYVNAASGDEGGELQLAKAVTNTTLAGPVNIDIYQNKLRFFVDGGDARGFYLDLSSGGATASTNIISSPQIGYDTDGVPYLI